MAYEYLLYEVKNRTAYLTLNRPAQMNALNPALKHELADAVKDIETNDDIWGAIVTANGRAFSSGTDIADFPKTVESARRTTAYAQALFNEIENLPKPVIAALNGYALGGGLELALACDIRVASDRVKVGFPEVKIGAIPCYGGTQRLTTLIGAGRAKEMIFTGRMVSADEALAMGIVEHVVPAGEELSKAEEILSQILKNAPMAVAYSKRCVNAALQNGLEYGLSLEENLVSMLVPTEDLLEGSSAFLEKRIPVFKNR